MKFPGHAHAKPQRADALKMSAQHQDFAIHPSTRQFNALYATSDDGSDVGHSESGIDANGEAESEAIPQPFSTSDSDISPELSEISTNIRRVLELRHRYIRLSLQGPEDNPRDWDDWKIYPPPPQPTWDEHKNRPMTTTESQNSIVRKESPSEHGTFNNRGQGSNHVGDSTRQQKKSPIAKGRKMGHDIGEDFDLKRLEPFPGIDADICFELDGDSVYQIHHSSQTGPDCPLVNVPRLRDYYIAMDEIQSVSSDGPTKSFAYRQLDILEGKFQLYFLVNSYQETSDCKKVPHRDFYNVRKVDTHVHHSACMNQKHLLRFIKSKMKKFPDEVVMFRDGKELTLEQVFHSINLTAYDLSIDTLDMHVSVRAGLLFTAPMLTSST